jgi:hypothetical protein
MGPREITYRFYKEMTFRFDKWRCGYGNLEISDEDLIRAFGLDWLEAQSELTLQNLRRYLRDTVAPRFYFNAARQAEYAQFVSAHYPHWIERAQEQANKICQHRFQLLGLEEMQLGESIDWQRDPETGRQWPRKHWIDIAMNGAGAAGDPKVIWELNRHQQLLWLGLAYFYTGDESYVNEYVYQIESWIEQNPYQIGINWASSLEVAFRAINWCWAVCFFINSTRLHNENILRIMKSLIQHMEAIAHNPSIYTSPNTHLIGEACALYIGGLLLAEHRSARSWRALGASLLCSEINRQFDKDGAHIEQSAYYHCYAIEFYLMVAALAHRNGIAIDEAMGAGLSRACEYLMQICQPCGELAAFGDEDGGKALMIGASNYRRPADLLATAAALFARGDFKYCAGEFQEATFWLLGAQSADRFADIKAMPSQHNSISLNAAGHAVLRENWSRDANYLLFHCPRKRSLNGHMHADCLSFELASGGRMRLIDSGTYRYNSSNYLRNYFRGVSAHNAVRINGLDQSQPGDTFKWRNQAQARISRSYYSAVADYVVGEHNGYSSIANPGLHRRAALFARPDYFVIFDEFLGSGEYDFESFLHFGAAQIEQIDRGWLNIYYPDGKKMLVAPLADQALAVEIIPCQEDGSSGWYSRAYGNKERGLSLRLHYRSVAPISMATILIPYQHLSPNIEMHSLGLPNSLCARVQQGDFDDLVIYSHLGGEFHKVVGNISFIGERLWLRARQNRIHSAFAINAKFISYDKKIILNDRSKHSHFVWQENSLPLVR